MPKAKAPPPDFHPDNPNWIHRSLLCRDWLRCNYKRLDELRNEGTVKPAPHAGYYLHQESVAGRIERLEGMAAGRRSQDGIHDVAAESAQLKKAQRERVQMQMERERGELVDAKSVVAIYQDLVRDVRVAILGIPGRIRGELPHMVTSEVEAIKNQCREVL